MEFQLRDYVIEAGRVEQFADEWRSAVRPLREAAGFVISSAWVVPETSRFIWLLGWDGAGTFAEADADYYRSPSRVELDPDPARLIVSAKEFSPAWKVG